MSTQVLAKEVMADDEFYSNYTNLELENLISVESYRAKYGDPAQELELLSPNFLNRVFDKPQDEFIALVKWEGIVTEINCDSFRADLIDSKNKTTEEAEFSLEEISEQDLDLLKLGSIFYWSIGYLDKVSGQRLKSSIIKFRRLPTWSKQDIEIAKIKAEEIINSLKPE